MTPPRDRFENQDASSRGSVGAGLAVGFGINLLLVVICALFIPVAPYLLPFVGVIQLVYMIPLILRAHRDQLPGQMKGLIIAASITFLLNAACDATLRF